MKKADFNITPPPSVMAERDDVLRKAYTDLVFFGKAFLPKDFLNKSKSPNFHYEVGKKLINTKPGNRTCIILPRGFGKSILSKTAIVHKLCFSAKDEQHFFAWISEEQTQAIDHIKYIRQHFEDNKMIEKRFIHVGDMPVMVKSHACILHTFNEQKLIDHQEDPRDPGGYFIINGSERVIVGLEDLSYNKIIVDAEKIGGKIVHKAKVYSSIIGYRAKLELVMKDDGMIVAKIPGSPVDIPIVTLMRALGLESDKDIAGAVSLVDDIQNQLEGSFEKAGDVTSAKDAIVYISKRIAPGMLEEFQIKRTETLLDWGLLPHLGKQPDNRKEKAHFLGEAVCKLIELRIGWIEQKFS